MPRSTGVDCSSWAEDSRNRHSHLHSTRQPNTLLVLVRAFYAALRVGTGDQGFRFTGTKGFTGKAGELHYAIFDQPGAANDVTIVSGDTNGDLVADFEIEIAGIVNFRSSDVLL